MAEHSAPAGEYVLTGVRFRQRHEDGSYTLYKRGDTVKLSAAEAARLAGKPNSSFKSKKEIDAEKKAREAALKAYEEATNPENMEPESNLTNDPRLPGDGPSGDAEESEGGEETVDSPPESQAADPGTVPSLKGKSSTSTSTAKK
jgi:hypothetical protein